MGVVNILNIKEAVSDVPLSGLVPFAEHVFNPYPSERMADLVLSVKERGVLSPIICRPFENGKFEILSGHNRVSAAKEACLQTIPAVVCEGLSDDEALFIVTETNLLQRSFADFLPSEKAAILASRHSLLSRQGERSDIFNEIEKLVSTFSPVAKKLYTHQSLSKEYGLGKDTIARYLRINKLIRELKDRMDNDKLPMRVAVSLSYLPEETQRLVSGLLEDKGYSISIHKAEAIRAEAGKRVLSNDDLKLLLSDKPNTAKQTSVKLADEVVSKYFKAGESPNEVASIISEALEMYFKNKN
jgi:ParB family chromosome partitioning protein